MIGKWEGTYKYSNLKIQSLVGHPETKFWIEIESFDGVNFHGIVYDDPRTGGMTDIGNVTGKLINDKISFTKKMPMAIYIDNKNGEKICSDKPHKPIYYIGKFSGDKTEFIGVWKFKRIFVLLLGIIPVLFNPGKGTWQIKKIENQYNR